MTDFCTAIINVDSISGGVRRPPKVTMRCSTTNFPKNSMSSAVTRHNSCGSITQVRRELGLVYKGS